MNDYLVGLLILFMQTLFISISLITKGLSNNSYGGWFNCLLLRTCKRKYRHKSTFFFYWLHKSTLNYVLVGMFILLVKTLFICTLITSVLLNKSREGWFQCLLPQTLICFYLSGLLPQYFGSEWSFAQFHLPEYTPFIAAFGSQNTVIIVGMDGRYTMIFFLIPFTAVFNDPLSK